MDEEETRFICPDCGKNFHTPENLLAHYEARLDAPCDISKMHMQSQHPDKEYYVRLKTNYENLQKFISSPKASPLPQTKPKTDVIQSQN